MTDMFRKIPKVAILSMATGNLRILLAMELLSSSWKLSDLYTYAPVAVMFWTYYCFTTVFALPLGSFYHRTPKLVQGMSYRGGIYSSWFGNN